LGRVVKRFVQIVLVNDQLFVGAADFFKEPLGSREGVHGIRSSMQQQQRTAKRFHSELERVDEGKAFCGKARGDSAEGQRVGVKSRLHGRVLSEEGIRGTA
jgi:hypothetical protein